MKKIVINKNKKQELINLLKGEKSYENFRDNKEKAYKFTSKTGIKICPYCNINYVYTVINKSGKEIIRPDLDHFEPQSIIRSKSLEWSNLIPSCQTCNSRLKGRKKFSEKTHIHPYKEDFDSIMRFSVSLKNTEYLNENNFDITFSVKDNAKNDLVLKAKKNIDDFKLEDRYQYHKNEVINIFQKIKFYNNIREKEISNLLGISGSLNTILFNDENNDINQVSLGKLKRDIIKKYKNKSKGSL